MIQCRGFASALVLALLCGAGAAMAAPPAVLQTRSASSPAPAALPDGTISPALPPAARVSSTLSEGVPLRIQLDGGYPIKVGTPISGHLIADVYSVDHVLLPAKTRVSGVIRATHPVARRARAGAMLNGDFTPLVSADVRFDSLTLSDGQVVAIKCDAVERTAKVIHMTSAKKSIIGMAKEQIRQRKQDAMDTVTAPGKVDRIRRYVYGQLPYHPQRIWTGTQYDADLTSPLTIPDKVTPLPMVALGNEPPVGTIQARLTTALSSATTQKGSAVEAVLSKPLMDPSGHQVLLAEGTRITGSVLQVKPAAWFARNGRLRFNFRSLEPVEGASRAAGEQAAASIHGQMTGAEATADQNLSIDSEGGAKAGADKNKVLAPLILGILAASSMDRDRDHEGDVGKNAVVSNGFGIAARLLTMATGNRNITSGFAYFAVSKSIYRRWIAKGHEIDLPRDTILEVELASR
jgi:hypothetical protein